MLLGKPTLFLFALLIFIKNGFAHGDASTCLEELAVVLNNVEISRVIERQNLMKVVRLSQDEDMGCESESLFTDEMSKLLKARDVDAPFWLLIDALKNELEALSLQERHVVVCEWRTLWMEKVTAHAVHVNSQKRPWDVGLRQSLAYNSNVALLEPDAVLDVADYRGKDWGLGLGGELRFRPTINMEKKLGWSYENQLNLYRQMQFDKDFLDVDLVSFSQKLTWFSPYKSLERVSLGWDYLKAFSKAPDVSREEYGRHAFRLKVRSEVVPLNQLPFDACVHRGSFQYRWKEEYPVPEDIYTWSVAYGVTLLAEDANGFSHSLGVDLSHDRDHADQNGLRDFEASSFMMSYGRSLADSLFSRPSSCMAALSVRNKQAANHDLDELQLFGSVALMINIAPYWSSSMSVTLIDKNRSSKDIQQWILTWNNDFATF